LETILSRRDYRTDALILAALWARAGARWPLDEIEAALNSPHYTPYFGRKSCPLMLPLAPHRQEAADPATALASRAADGPEPERQIFRLSHAAVVITLTEADAREFGVQVRHVEIRRDAVISRRRWQFALRADAVLAADQ
jgi:CRISPR system Cascade subunit CasD